jgi:hypothetical protein
MTGQRVIATYSAPVIFQSTDLWEHVRSAIVAQLPLRNLHWKPASRSSIRTVQELSIDLVPYETTGRTDHASQVPGSVLEKPLLNIYIVACEVRLHSTRSCYKVRACSSGCRNLPGYGEEANQRLVHSDHPTKKSRMACCPHRVSGFSCGPRDLPEDEGDSN